MKNIVSKPLILSILVVLIVVGIFDVNHLTRAVGISPIKSTVSSSAKSSAPAVQPSPCTSNTLAAVIIVGLNQQQMWACSFAKTAYTSAVITGYTGLAADVTPTGNYVIFAKETNITLTGTDGVTNWNDPVSYWMPYLFNEYGAYGFHDATWRTQSQFGSIPTSSPNASHGCVELPLATAHWLFDWSTVGTQIQIQQSA